MGGEVDGALELEKGEAGRSLEEGGERVLRDAVRLRGAAVNWDGRHVERRLFLSTRSDVD